MFRVLLCTHYVVWGKLVWLPLCAHSHLNYRPWASFSFRMIVVVFITMYTTMVCCLVSSLFVVTWIVLQDYYDLSMWSPCAFSAQGDPLVCIGSTLVEGVIPKYFLMGVGVTPPPPRPMHMYQSDKIYYLYKADDKKFVDDILKPESVLWLGVNFLESGIFEKWRPNTGEIVFWSVLQLWYWSCCCCCCACMHAGRKSLIGLEKTFQEKEDLWKHFFYHY